MHYTILSIFLSLCLNCLNLLANEEIDYSRTISLYISELKSEKSIIVAKAIKKLKRFTFSEYDSKSKEKIALLLKPQQYHFKGVIELAGFLKLQDSLNAVTQEELKTQSLIQAHGFAQIRAGNTEKLNTLMVNVRKLDVNDEFIYNVAPKLIYTRNKTCVDYLLEIIMSNELNCTSSDPESNQPIICAYRLIELLAPAIYYFPFTTSRSGSLEVDDYEVALIEMRKWILENKETYSLDMETY